MDNPGEQLRSSLLEHLGACAERDQALVVPSIQDGWIEGCAREPELARRLSMWMIDEFTEPEHAQATRRAMVVPRLFFRRLAKLNYALTGEPSLLDENLIWHLEQDLLLAHDPTAAGVVHRAKHGPALDCKVGLQQLLGLRGERWTLRY